MSDSTQKPQCGSDVEEGEYDLALHVVAIFLVLLASVFGAGFPVLAKKVRWLRIPPKLFFFCKHFGTGVLIATAFVHLLPTAFFSLSDPCLPDLFTEQYPPMPGVIMMAALFCLFVIEMWLNAKTGGHSHGGATGADIIPNNHGAPHAHPHPVHAAPAMQRTESYESEDWIQKEKDYNKEYSSHATEMALPSEMPTWFVVFYEQYVRQRDEMMRMIRNNAPAVVKPAEQPKDTQVTGSYFETDVEEQPDPMVLKRMNLNISLLEGGILFHSVFVGMTVSITTDGFITLLVAILFHQMFEGLGLGSRIAAVPYHKKSPRPWILVFAFGTTAPFGQMLGIVTRGSYDPSSAFGLILVGVFNAISSGLLIYAALVDLLAEDFLSEEADREMNGKKKAIAFLYVLLGAIGMSIVGAFA